MQRIFVKGSDEWCDQLDEIARRFKVNRQAVMAAGVRFIAEDLGMTPVPRLPEDPSHPWVSERIERPKSQRQI